MTVKEWTLHWMETYDRPKSRPTTAEAHRYIMQNHIIPGLGEVLLSELTEDRVREFLKDVFEHGNRRPESKCYPQMSPQSMRHIHRLLSQCLTQAVIDGLLSTNSAQAFNCEMPKTVTVNALSGLEVEDYLDAAQRLGYLPMFTLELTSGLRLGELIALKWTDLNVEDMTLTVHGGACGGALRVGGVWRQHTGASTAKGNCGATGAGTRPTPAQCLHVLAPRHTKAVLAQHGPVAPQADQ